MKKLLVITTILSLTFAAQDTKQVAVQLEKANNNSISLQLDVENDVYGLQFDITYNAAHIALSEENIVHAFDASDSRSGMSVYSKVKEAGKARVIVFDLGGQPLIVAGSEDEDVINIAYDVVDGFSGETVVTIDKIVAAGHHGTEEETTETVSLSLTPGNGGDNGSGVVGLPEKTEIKGNYPNPFNPRTEIKFNLAQENEGLVEVAIYNVAGQRVATLHNDITTAGYEKSYIFDAGNLASGQYFVRITAPGFSEVRPMTFLK